MRFEPRSAQRRETSCYSSIYPLPLISLISQLKLKSVGGRDEYSYDGGYWADIWRCTPPTMSCATGKGRIGVGGGEHVTRSSWPRRLSNFCSWGMENTERLFEPGLRQRMTRTSSRSYQVHLLSRTGVCNWSKCFSRDFCQSNEPRQCRQRPWRVFDRWWRGYTTQRFVLDNSLIIYVTFSRCWIPLVGSGQSSGR